MKNIAVITTTRAEYGLLSPIIEELRKYERDDFRVELLVTGTHLSREYGFTIQEIQEEGQRIDEEIYIEINNENPRGISQIQADTLIQFTKIFVKKKYGAIIILGDRYEMLAVAMAAQNTLTPIIHIFGGDVSIASIDTAIRDCITKLSQIHFPTSPNSQKRIHQLGENPNCVYNYGSPGVDNIIHKANMSKKEVLYSIGLHDCKYALCTYHPTTLQEQNFEMLLNNILAAIQEFPQIEFIFTKSNSDKGGAEVNRILDREGGKIANLHVYESLGNRRYLSLMKFAEFVLGNSSSGLLEAPVFHVPTVNVGERQKGRYKTGTVIDSVEDRDAIVDTIKIAMTYEFKEKCRKATNPYGDGNASNKIAAKIIEHVKKGIELQKEFHWL